MPMMLPLNPRTEADALNFEKIMIIYKVRGKKK
jgi:hypothetical protein